MSTDESKSQEHSSEPSTKDLPAPGESGVSNLTMSSDVGGDGTVSAKPGHVQQSTSRSTEVCIFSL